MQRIKEVTIIGLGVIGGSLGLALKKRCPFLRIRGVDLRLEIIEEAARRQAIDFGTMDLAEGVKEADLVFLAVPLSVLEQICRQIAPHLPKGAIVTDTGSTKTNVVKIMSDTLPDRRFFLGGHPMAGSEKTGLDGATELLFENAAYLLTPLPGCSEEVIRVVRNCVELLGAHVIILSPEEHDRKVAAVSHLPHVVASALAGMLGRYEAREGGYFPLAAGGFRDSTRIALSDSSMWTDILRQNRQALLPLLTAFKECLEDFADSLFAEDTEALRQLLDEGRKCREQLPTGIKSILPGLYELFVTVPDQPGAIAQLTLLLSREDINISDIEIMRVREENDRTIRLGFVRENQRDLAQKVLADNGYAVS